MPDCWRVSAGCFLWFCISIALTACRPSTEPQGLVDVGARYGITHANWFGRGDKQFIRETLGQGACWLDHDNDGDMDLFIPNGSRRFTDLLSIKPDEFEPWRFYINEGVRFREAAASSGLDIRGWGTGCAIGDINADGYDDIFVTTASGSNRLLLNTGTGKFEDRTEQTGLINERFSTGAAFGDLDRDGDLDLLVATYLDESQPPEDDCRWKGVEVMCGPKGFPMSADLLYRNDGGRFTEVPALQAYKGYGLGVVLFDVEPDGDSDIFIANDSSENRLFINQGNWQFKETGLMAGVALSGSGMTQAGMGVDAGDLDGDGLPDLVVTNFSDDTNNFYRNEGRGMFNEWASRSGMESISYAHLGWAVLLEDFDLDGDLDVFIVNGHVYPQADDAGFSVSYRQPMQLLFNDGRGILTENRQRLGKSAELAMAARGAAPADFDGDGDIDIVIIRDAQPPLLLRNDLPEKTHHWLRVRLRGGPGNPHAIGARIVIDVRGKQQTREIRANRGYLSAGEPVATFGLGGQDRVDRITVYWPDGTRQQLAGVSADQVLIVDKSN